MTASRQEVVNIMSVVKREVCSPEIYKTKAGVAAKSDYWEESHNFNQTYIIGIMGAGPKMSKS